MSCPSDLTFGPTVSGCRGNFDFTIKFEDIVLSLIPSSCFIPLAAARLWFLIRAGSGKVPTSSRAATVGTFNHLGIAKLALALAYSSVRLSVVVVAGKHLKDETPKLSMVALAVTFASSAFIAPLTVLEHHRAKRPSFLLGIYLFFSFLFDIAQTRTRWLQVVSANSNQIMMARLHTAAVAIKAGLLILESQKKTRYRHLPAEERAGPFNLAAYTWLYSLYFKGYRKVLSLDDLDALDSHMQTEALVRKLSPETKSNNSTSTFKLAIVLVKNFSTPLLLPILPRLALVGFRFCQPFLVHSVLHHMEHYLAEDPAWRNAGYGFIGAAVFIYFGVAFSTAFYWYCHERFISMTRGGLVAAIYEKLIQLRTVDVSDSAAVTLMSTDIERIRYGMLNLHEFWAVPIEVGLASWLLYNQLGVAFVAPLVVVISCVVCSSVLNRYTGSRQKEWMDKIQTRVAETAKMLGCMKQLKISGLSQPVEEAIQGLRDSELKAASKFRRLYVSNMAFGFAPMALCPVITFAVTARDLDTSTIFTSLAYLILLANPLGELFGEIPYLLAAFTSLERIQDFLCKETQPNTCRFVTPESSEFDGSRKPDHRPSIGIHDIKIGWTRDSKVFKNLTMGVHGSSLTMLVGPVGSGKSTLCKALISEVPFTTGSVNIATNTSDFKTAFCDQSPFISNTSIRQNIAGSSPFDPIRYEEVIRATVLSPDFQSLPQGDATVVGSGGTTLSGGQKQRVAIARALYHDANFLVFDDSLSGLDADTELEVFMRVFGPDGILRRRKSTVLLATHNVRHLPQADRIVVLAADRTVSYEGDYLGLIAAGVRRQSQQLNESIDISTTKKAQGFSRKDKAQDMDHEQGKKNAVIETDTATVGSNNKSDSSGGSFLSDKDRMTGDSTVYRYYLASLGKLAIIAFIVFGMGWGFFYNFGYIWLRFWSRDEEGARSRSFYIGLFGLWQAGGLLSVILCYWTSYTMMARVSGSKLHHSALKSVINAPLSFTTATDIGVITNLFSQDMTLIDNELPVAITNLALDICNALGIAAVIATSSPFLVISYPVLLVILYFIQKFYLRTARQLRLLDLEAKSPLYTHFLDTSRGLATIRAFGWARDHVRVALKLVDASQKPAYLLAMVQRWLLFVLQCVVAILAILVITLATQGSRSRSTGFTGASLVALMTFGEVLNFIIRWWTQLETSIGAVTRLKALNDRVPGEGSKDETGPLPEGWPSHGGIEMMDVSAAYRYEVRPGEEDPSLALEKPPDSVLENLTLSIKPGEKVAICGRSGSGKSSTILLLLRMLDSLPSSLTGIIIDGVPLHTIDRTEVRDSIIAMSQDPVFLPGQEVSLKGQLDPRGQFTELECRSVLQLVGLGHLAGEHSGRGLDEIELDAEALSGGQKQLFNLARTVLRGRGRARANYSNSFSVPSVPGDSMTKPGGILLLDEVSASVDKKTEETMLRIIRDEFGGYTVIMVSHRLQMVMDFDRVLVMEKGRVVENGNPRLLASENGTRFGQLWEASGAAPMIQ